MTSNKIVLSKVGKDGNDFISIQFAYNSKLNQIVKSIAAVRFSMTHKCWLAPFTPSAANTIYKVCKSHGIELDYSRISFDKSSARDNAQHDQTLRMMEQKLNLKGYSVHTKKNYLSQFSQFLKFYGGTSPTDLTETEIRNYLLYLVENKKISRSAQNQSINAIKFFYEIVLMQDRKVYYLERPLKEKRLPEVLSQEEITSLFSVIRNIKHKAMLMMIYSAGLRRGELLRLRKSDVDFYRKVVFIKGSKGRKDRQSLLARSLEPILQEYLEQYKPQYWMFEGEKGGMYGERSIGRVLESYCTKANISKEITLHTLRHSFATHLLEAGTSTRYIQELLGHESPLTTEIYTHVSKLSLSKIQSPLDHIVQQSFSENGEGN
ncbi:MAG: tyrosine-type recombinase/integrase [Cyclobacteriaceae bacterium]